MQCAGELLHAKCTCHVSYRHINFTSAACIAETYQRFHDNIFCMSNPDGHARIWNCTGKCQRAVHTGAHAIVAGHAIHAIVAGHAIHAIVAGHAIHAIVAEHAIHAIVAGHANIIHKS